MKQLTNIFFTGIIALLALQGCSSSKGEKTGHEFMPDMYHSIAYEANYSNYYWFNTWGEKEAYRQMTQPREPVAGTIPRGYTGIAYAQNDQEAKAAMVNLKGGAHANAVSVPLNGWVPYYYEDTDDERIRATNEIVNNPFPITSDGLAHGKELYTIFCGICHGEKGDGNGYLVRDDGGVYPAQPTSFLTDEMMNSSNGRFFHGIMYGKNVMGSYKDKLNYEERWQVVHYIRSLQAKEKKLVYDENANTLNNVDIPGSTVAIVEEVMEQGDSGLESADDQEQGHGGDH